MAKSMSEVKQWFEELHTRVEAAGGVLSIRMGELRDGIGAGRLDKGPLRQIAAALDSAGLGSIVLDTDQWTPVLIYIDRSPVARVIEAVTSYKEEADKELISAITGYTGENDPRDEELARLRDTLAQVQAIVSDIA